MATAPSSPAIGSFVLPNTCHIGCTHDICRLKRKADSDRPLSPSYLQLPTVTTIANHPQYQQQQNGPGMYYTPHPRGTTETVSLPRPVNNNSIQSSSSPYPTPDTQPCNYPMPPTFDERPWKLVKVESRHSVEPTKPERPPRCTIPKGIHIQTARLQTSNSAPTPITVKASETSFVVPSEVTIRAKTWGDSSIGIGGDKCILAVHGWLDNASTFDLLAPLLAEKGAYVVCIDLAGHGLSDHRPPQGGYYLWDMIDDILGVVDALNWSTFTYLGHSTGAHIGAAFASTFPTRVTSLIMLESIGTAVQFKNPEPVEMATFIRRRRELNKWGKATRVYDSFEDAARARTKGFTKVGLEAARLLCERGLEPVFPKAEKEGSGVIGGELRYVWRTDPRLTLWAYLHCNESTIRAFFREIRCPVLVVIGEKSGLFNLEVPKFKERLENLKNGRTVLVPGGHHLHLEREFVGGVLRECTGFLGWT